MRTKFRVFLLMITFLVMLVFVACESQQTESIVVKSYPVKNLDKVLTEEGIEFDEAVSADGNGSIKIVAPESTTVRLYETGDLDLEKVKLVYSAKIKTENVIGQVYLEMWCAFAGKGEFFSRGLQGLISGNSKWTETETLFFLKKGENPDNIKLNVVINGSGTVWIDDIKLVKYPLNRDEQL